MLSGAVFAQPSDKASDDAARGETVSWTVSTSSAETVQPGGRLALTVRGTVLAGWHVYSLKQLPNGPTPLHVTVDPNDVAKLAGDVAGSVPTKIHDAGFDLETQYYSQEFTLSVPVQVGLKPGARSIPISVRFQTCNDRICQPPKTVHLSAPVNVRADG
jgi:DsbC/DsbD-like thiol-disulfide interchange protein